MPSVKTGSIAGKWLEVTIIVSHREGRQTNYSFHDRLSSFTSGM